MSVQACGVWIVLVLIGGTLSENVGRFWHLTDIHYDNTYWTSQLSCKRHVSKPGQYGDHWCDSPWSLVQDAINNMARIDNGVDFILWTGDNVGHFRDSETNLKTNMEIMKNVTSALSTALPDIPVYASLGNHDFYPSDQASDSEKEVYRDVADIWDKWLDQSQKQQFKQGGYYMTMAQPKIRLLNLNTNFYYHANPLTASSNDPGGQFAWMESQLQEAKSQGEKVIVTGHVPPGLTTPDLTDWFYPRHKSRFMDIILRYSDTITASHFGHDHSDGFKILQDGSGSRAVAQFTAPSVTPWRYDNDHNPGVRLVEYDRDTGKQLNYHQYYTNLTESNSQGQTNWRELYSFKDAYKVQDMGAASLREIFSRLEKGGGEEYTSKYCKFSVVSSQDKPCTDRMRAEIYCGGLIYEKSKALACVSKYLEDMGTS